MSATRLVELEPAPDGHPLARWELSDSSTLPESARWAKGTEGAAGVVGVVGSALEFGAAGEDLRKRDG